MVGRLQDSLEEMGTWSQSFRKKCNRIVRSSGSKSMSSSKSLPVPNWIGWHRSWLCDWNRYFGLKLGVAHIRTTVNGRHGSTRVFSVFFQVPVNQVLRFQHDDDGIFGICVKHVMGLDVGCGQNRVRDKVAYLWETVAVNGRFVPFFCIFVSLWFLCVLGCYTAR